MAVRRCKKQDLKRIAKATGANFVTSLANVDGEESFEASMLGEAAEVSQERISDDELILIKGTKARTASSIILRGPNDFYCDKLERSVHDALCVVKRVLESKSVCIGGGCVEAALSIYLAWRTLLLLPPAESSSPLLTSWLSPRPWLSTLPRTPVTWLPS